MSERMKRVLSVVLLAVILVIIVGLYITKSSLISSMYTRADGYNEKVTKKIVEICGGQSDLIKKDQIQSLDYQTEATRLIKKVKEQASKDNDRLRLARLDLLYNLAVCVHTLYLQIEMAENSWSFQEIRMIRESGDVYAKRIDEMLKEIDNPPASEKRKEKGPIGLEPAGLEAI